MKPVFQTNTKHGTGNCFAACVASILEKPLEEVPNFCTMPEWKQRFADWLYERGLGFIGMPAGLPFTTEYSGVPTYWIGSGPTVRSLRPGGPRGELTLHAVVMSMEQDGRIRVAHDPNPDAGDDGLAYPVDHIFIVRWP